MSNPVNGNKRKASEFFNDSITKPKVTFESHAELVKQSIQLQLANVIATDTKDNLKKVSATKDLEYHNPFVKSELISAIDDESTTSVENQYNKFKCDSRQNICNESEDDRHNKAIFSTSLSSSYAGEKKKSESINKVMINSFSKESDEDTSVSGTSADVPVPYVSLSKFSKNFLAKASSDSTQSTNVLVDTSLPLYKRIKAKDRVMARYAADGQLYPAVIKAVMHGGYASAQYDVVFAGYEAVETIRWADVDSILPPEDDNPLPTGSVVSSAGQGPVVVNVADLSRMASGSGGVMRDAFPPTQAAPVIKSIRFDSATGLAIINEPSKTVSTAALNNLSYNSVGGSSRIELAPVPGVATNHTSFVVQPLSKPVSADKDWTVSKPIEVPLFADATKLVGESVVNPQLLRRAKGGWKSKK